MMRGQRRIQSIEAGGRLLLALGRSNTPLALKDLARLAAMTPARAHPYLVSFQQLGLIQQDVTSGHYDLGHEALRLGIAAIQRVDAVKIARDELMRLVPAERHSSAIAIWGNLGPTIVQFDEADYPLHVYLRSGTVLSLANTATGLLFAAFMPERIVREALKADKHRFGGTPAPIKLNDLASQIADIRRHGLSRNVGVIVPGVNSISAPVFDHSGQLALAIAIMGPGTPAEAELDSSMARTAADCARRISLRLGFSPDSTHSHRL